MEVESTADCLRQSVIVEFDTAVRGFGRYLGFIVQILSGVNCRNIAITLIVKAAARPGSMSVIAWFQQLCDILPSADPGVVEWVAT